MHKTIGLLALTLFMTARGNAGAQAVDSNRVFLRENANAPGVTAVPGIQYTVLKSGPVTGAHPTRTSAIKVRYEGRYINGDLFDSSNRNPDSTTVFPLKLLIPGFVAAVQMMRPGDRWKVFIPPELAYGLPGGKHALAGKLLVFTIELVDWSEMPPQPSPVLKELPPKAPAS